jgi:hypothetical protein
MSRLFFLYRKGGCRGTAAGYPLPALGALPKKRRKAAMLEAAIPPLLTLKKFLPMT